MRARILTWIGIAVSLAVVVHLVSSVDLAAAFRAMALAGLPWLLAAAALYLAIFPIRGLRWSISMSDLRRIPVQTTTEVFVVGAMANNVMPARLGDVVRAYILARRADVPATTTFSNVLLERILDGFTVVGLLAAVLMFAPPGEAWVHTVGGAMGVLFVGALLGACLVAWNEALALRILAIALRPFPSALSARLDSLARRLAAGVRVLKNAGSVGKILALSVAIWLLEVCVYALVQRAFGLEAGEHVVRVDL